MAESTRAQAAMRESWSRGPSRAKLWPRTANTAVAVRAGPSRITPASDRRRAGPVEPGPDERQSVEGHGPTPGPAPGRRGPDPDRRTTGSVEIDGGLVTGSRPRRRLAAGTARRGPSPPHHQRQPLLAGAAEDGPEGQGHADRHGGHGQGDAAQRGPRPEGQHGDDQADRHRGDLPAPPPGDHPAPLQGGEPVADPLVPGRLRHRRHRRGAGRAWPPPSCPRSAW